MVIYRLEDASLPNADDRNAINNCHLRPKNIVTGSITTLIL